MEKFKLTFMYYKWLILCALIGFSNLQGQTNDVSILRIIVSPSNYKQKLISTKGVLRVGPDLTALFPTKDDAIYGNSSSAVWLYPPARQASASSKVEDISKFNMNWVTVTGVVVEAGEAGHLGLFSSAIKVHSINLWPKLQD